MHFVTSYDSNLHCNRDIGYYDVIRPESMCNHLENLGGEGSNDPPPPPPLG